MSVKKYLMQDLNKAEQAVRVLQIENDRLRRGDFTDEEFLALEHNENFEDWCIDFVERLHFHQLAKKARDERFAEEPWEAADNAPRPCPECGPTCRGEE